ncbi:MAG: 50S ribosomal protein L4 [Elusimicrobia bacterium]|jgi:large subunit ribosomal protein L4|nr:50S ribosomal protein L4 [Elusimicrobiota bacterium]
MKISTPKITKKVKDIKISKTFLHEVINSYLSNKRQGTAKVKDRGEVAGSGKKPWRQKGTGRARAGARQSPIWTGGGVTFGPTGNENYKKKINKKKKRLALVQAIAVRLKEENIKVVDSLELEENKTRLAAKAIDDILDGEKENKTLLFLKDYDAEIVRPFRNIKFLTIKTVSDINAYLVLMNKNLIFTKAAWESFIAERGIK